MRELRGRGAFEVFVAVNNRLIWADIFASTALLQKYWPKLIRSYAAETLTESPVPVGYSKRADVKLAQAFVESEPGVYRHTELEGAGLRIFELASVLPGTGFDVHVAKMTEQGVGVYPWVPSHWDPSR